MHNQKRFFNIKFMKTNESPKRQKYDPGAWTDSEEFGIDMSMLIDNTKRTIGERIRRHQTALNAVEKLKKAKRL